MSTEAQAREPKLDGRRARRELTRASILSHAIELFADQGFSAGVDEIAAAAQVSKGSVFYNFDSKEALFDAAVEYTLHELEAVLAAARVGHTGRAALEAQSWAVMNRVSGELALGRLLVREIFARSGAPARPASRSALLEPLVASMREVRTELTGESPAEAADFEVLGIALLAALLGATLDRESYTPEKPLAEVHERLMMVLGALGGR